MTAASSLNQAIQSQSFGSIEARTLTLWWISESLASWIRLINSTFWALLKFASVCSEFLLKIWLPRAISFYPWTQRWSCIELKDQRERGAPPWSTQNYDRCTGEDHLYGKLFVRFYCQFHHLCLSWAPAYLCAPLQERFWLKRRTSQHPAGYPRKSLCSSWLSLGFTEKCLDALLIEVWKDPFTAS